MSTPCEPGFDVDDYRNYLKLLGRLQISPQFGDKLDLSGIVQDTLLEAHQAAATLQIASESARLAWLRRAFGCNLADELRKLGTAARDISRELQSPDALEKSSARLEAWLIGDFSTPGTQAARNEQLLRLAAELDALPEDQRLAVELRHLHGLPLAEVAERLNRSRDAAAGLVIRGLRQLRQKMAE